MLILRSLHIFRIWFLDKLIDNYSPTNKENIIKTNVIFFLSLYQGLHQLPPPLSPSVTLDCTLCHAHRAWQECCSRPQTSHIHAHYGYLSGRPLEDGDIDCDKKKMLIDKYFFVNIFLKNGYSCEFIYIYSIGNKRWRWILYHVSNTQFQTEEFFFTIDNYFDWS